jgi:hypothetical protein
MSQIITITTPLEALRYAAWAAFKKVAVEIDIERDSHLRKNGHLATYDAASPFAGQNATREFHHAMGVDMPDIIDTIFPPPPRPTYAQTLELSKHKEAFLQTWFSTDTQRLCDLIAHYDEEKPYSLGLDQGWTCAEFLSMRPSADKIEPPLADTTTHNRILSYIWADIGGEQYESDLSALPAKVTLSWIRHEVSRTIADEMQTLSFTA